MKTVLLLLALVLSTVAADTLTLTFDAKENSASFLIGRGIIDEINRRLDSTLYLTLEFMPFGRSAIKLCDGELDGDFSRMEYVYNNCPDVIKIPVVILEDFYYAFGKAEAHKRFLTHPDSSARYITVLGNKAIQYWKEVHNVPCHEVLDYRQAVKMIDLDRVDFYLGSEVYAYDSLFADLNIVPSAVPILTTEYFLFLNPTHEEHAGQLTKVLYDMKEEGVLKQLIHGGAK